MTNAAPEALIFPDTVTHNEASGCLDLLSTGVESRQRNEVGIEEVQSLGKNLTILGLPKQLQELANLYGIQSVLEN